MPGAIATDVNTTLARETSPRRTLAQANDRRRSRAASSSAASVAARARGCPRGTQQAVPASSKEVSRVL